MTPILLRSNPVGGEKRSLIKYVRYVFENMTYDDFRYQRAIAGSMSIEYRASWASNVINHGRRSHFQNAKSKKTSDASCSFRSWHDSIVMQTVVPFRIFWLSNESLKEEAKRT
jgi:hypothetical protein